MLLNPLRKPILFTLLTYYDNMCILKSKQLTLKICCKLLIIDGNKAFEFIEVRKQAYIPLIKYLIIQADKQRMKILLFSVWWQLFVTKSFLKFQPLFKFYLPWQRWKNIKLLWNFWIRWEIMFLLNIVDSAATLDDYCFL